MAWSSSSSESGEQTPRSPLPSRFGSRVCTFAEFLAARQQGRQDELLPPVVPTPAPCGHCGQREDLARRIWSPAPDTDDDGIPYGSSSTPLDHRGAASEASLVDRVAFEGNSCFTCVRRIYQKTPWVEENDRQDTPLHYAARCRNHTMAFHFVCMLGDAFGLAWATMVVRTLNTCGETALHEAIRLGSWRTARLLMWVDPELAQHPESGQGTSPMYLAVSLGHKHIAEMLHSENRGKQLSYSGPDGQNALHAAVLNPSGMIEMLLNWNEHLIKEKDKNDSTPLHLVVSAQYEPYVRRYDFRVPDVLFPMKKLATWRVLNANTSAAYQQDINGLYPVHIAALMNRRVAIAILHRKCRGCVGLRDKQGRSFLHIAVQYKSYNVVGYACGESEFASMMNFRNNDGNTALHLAVEVGDIWIFCRLLRKSEVLLNLRNKKGETPLDLAWSKRQETSFSYGRNPENVIHSTLKLAGAVHGSFWRDYLEQIHIGERKPTKEDEEKEEKKDKKDSAKLTDATRTLGIGLVLIASVTFSATFAVAGAFKTSDNNDGGTPTTHKWYFKAFIFANTLAFICSAAATISLMYSGMPMVKLQIRRRHFQTSLNLATSSLSCWAVAFTIGVYMVLAPGGRVTATAISVIIPIVTLYLYMQELFLKMSAVRQSLIARRRIPSYGQRMRVWIISTFYAGRGR